MSSSKFLITGFLTVVVLSAAATTYSASEAQPYGGGFGPGMIGGYGMGPGMMGGMMGARNRACNPDGSVPNFGFRTNAGALNLSAADVRKYLESRIAWSGNPNVKTGDVTERDANTITAMIVTQNNSLVSEFAFDRHTGFSCFVVAQK